MLCFLKSSVGVQSQLQEHHVLCFQIKRRHSTNLKNVTCSTSSKSNISIQSRENKGSNSRYWTTSHQINTSTTSTRIKFLRKSRAKKVQHPVWYLYLSSLYHHLNLKSNQWHQRKLHPNLLFQATLTWDLSSVVIQRGLSRSRIKVLSSRKASLGNWWNLLKAGSSSKKIWQLYSCFWSIRARIRPWK